MNQMHLSDKPLTGYAKSGSINIAYQTFGSGPVDLVYIPGWISNIDWMWQCPELVSFLHELGKVARVILFDKRGTGLSDRIVELSTLEERMDDIRAVMDAVGSKRAVLFGHSEGGSASVLFAATYPNRVISLITFGAFAKRRYAENYPWAPTNEERQEVYDMIENYWGNGKMNLEILAPSKANDPIFMDWLANYFRSGASPSAAMLLTKMNTQVDIIDILSSIRVPTLIMQRIGDIDVQIEEGRFLAERIQGAKLVELDGSDHLFWVGKTKKVLDEMRTFISEVKTRKNYEKQLLTILLINAEPYDNTLLDPRATIDQVINKYKGRQISDDKLLVSVFEGPSSAVECGLDLLEVAHGLNINVGMAVHIMEVEITETHTLCGKTKIFTDSFLEKINPNQVLITQTVKYLLSGIGLVFTKQHDLFQYLGNEPLILFSVSDPNTQYNSDRFGLQLLPNNAFIDKVLNSIRAHLKDDFTIEILCKDIGISERQLQRKTKAITNKSPNQLITSVRLHRAKELILSFDDFNINEIAFQTGFSNPSYFSKCFKKEFGVSPSALL